MSRWANRAAAVVVGLVAALSWAGIAVAHVEVEANPDVAGSANAVVTFSAEAENPKAGITSVQIVLPAGLTSQDVSYRNGPPGWTLTATADGYTVGGAALPKGDDAVHSIVVKRLPVTNELVFKALVTYADKSVDRWIEEKSAANPNPDNPAPVLTLKPGARPAGTTTAPAGTTTAAPTATVAVAPAPSPPASSPDSGNDWLWWLLGAAVVIGGGTAFALARRRRDAAGS